MNQFLLRFFLASLLLCFMWNLSLGQEKSASGKHTISGYVKDETTGEYMIGANVYIKELMKGTSTNLYGFYSLTLKEGNYTLVISYLGYGDIEQEIELTKNIRINRSLKSKAILAKEFEVTGERNDANVQSAEMGVIELEVEKIKTLPAFLGEIDVLKTIQLLPGVQSATEGSSGFYVRGGGPDQNLILLDEAVVYNAAHLFGFFSIFNADAVKKVELIKGNIPAQYGGRLASVLNITMKEGNSKKYEVDGGIGLISSRLTVQGPIKKDTSSFIISGRRTYIDILMKPFIPESSPFSGSGYYFYDLNTKINYRLSDKDRLFMSGYFGRDVFTYNNDDNGFSVKIPWGNATTSFRWNHLFNDKLFLNTTVLFSDYQFEFVGAQSDFEFKLHSGIRDWNAKLDFNYFPSIRHNVKFGMNYIYHTFIPGTVTAKSNEVEFDTGDIIKYYAHDGAAYINDEFDLNDKIRINAGLRYSLFQHIGPFERFSKDQAGNVTNSEVYAKGEKVATYQGLEPRFTFRYSFNTRSSFKAGYTHNYQYIHLASLSALSLPTDVWVPSTDKVKPQIGTQYAIGYFRNFKENQFETSVELYYKEMDNLVEYKEGALPEENINDNPDNQFTFGKGTSYGAELFIKKRTGNTTGWIGYTWSKTMRVFPEINDGEEFPAKFDRLHDLSIIASHEIKRWTFSAVFVYATGNSLTLPVSRYVIEGQIVNEYGVRNSVRMKSYHRLDVSATLKGKERKKFRSSWNFSVFNVYNRANPFFIYFDNEGDLDKGTLKITAKQVSLFPILPSITWNFEF